MSTSLPAVLITGASSGIGAALARQAGAAGYRVLVGYGAGRARGEQVAGEIVAAGGRAEPVAIPLADPEGIDAAVERLAAADAPPQAAVLAASAPPLMAAFTKTRPEDMRRQFEIAGIGHQRLIAALWKKAFRPRGGGHLVGVLSKALGPPPAPNMSAYVVGKAAMLAVLDCAAAEFGPGGLRVSVLSPGYTETPMLDAFEPRFLEMARGAGGRFATAEQVARVLLDSLLAPPPPGRVQHLQPPG